MREHGQQPTGVSRRQWLRVAGLAPAALMSAAACRPARRVVPEPEAKPVTLEYWHSWTMHWEDMTKFVAQAFHGRYPHITVNQVVVSPLMDKVLAAIAGASPPDVATVYSAIHIPSLAEGGAALPMEEHATRDDVARAKAWYHPMVWELGTYKGRVYGLSYWQQAACLGWNKQVFVEANLDPNRPPRTIAELDEFAFRLTRFSQDGAIERMGFLPASIWHWVPVFGGQFFDDRAGKITANHPNNLKALEWMVGYRQRLTPERIDVFMKRLTGAQDRGQQGEPFLNNQYAMVEVGGPWKLGDWKKFGPADFQYGIAPYPNPPGLSGTATWTYGDLSVVPQGAKHPREAWRFVMFTGGVGGEDDYAKVLLWGGGHPINVPVSTRMLGHPAVQQAIRDYPGFDTMIKLVFEGTRVGIPPKTPVGTLYQQRLSAAVASALRLEQPPKVALDAVTDEVQKEHDQYFVQKK